MLNRNQKLAVTICYVLAALAVIALICLLILAPDNQTPGNTNDSSEEKFTTTEKIESVSEEIKEETPVEQEEEPEVPEEKVEEKKETTESVAEEVVEYVPSPEKEDIQVQKFNLTAEEREMLAAIIWLEARGESYECQLAVGSTILNRIKNGYWGDTLEEVLYAPGQYTPAARIKSTTPGETQYQVVDQLLRDGPTLPYYVLYFRAWYYFDWATPYTHIDETYFSYLEKDK